MKNIRKYLSFALMAAGILMVIILLMNQQPTPPAESLPPPFTSAHTQEPSAMPPAQTVSPTGEPVDNPALVGEVTPDAEQPEESGAPTTVVGQVPVGKLIITKERKGYADGDLTIYIPTLDITSTVYNGTGNTALKNGVGLYDYSQLPGEGSRNVSIAGHRDVLINGKSSDGPGAPFYYIDTLTDGDYLYLYSDETVYRYVWESSWIIADDDWDPIRTTDYSCITLTSCHPIGVSSHRIVVRATLDEIADYNEAYEFLPSRSNP